MKEDIRKNEKAAFIPCGDSIEKMQEICEDDLEKVTGGYGEGTEPNCEKCGAKMECISAGTEYYYVCNKCNNVILIPG